MTRINVSLHVFDLLKMGEVINEFLNADIDMFHIDIMDGSFVKNYALCQKNISDIKKTFPNVLIDAHLMVNTPEEYIEEFSKSGADIYNFHYEAVKNKDINSIISKIKENNMKASIMINLDTDIKKVEKYVKDLDYLSLMSIRTGFPGQDMNEAVIEKIKEANKLKAINKNLIIEVDGGVRENTYEKICKAGADVIVVGHFMLNQKFSEQKKKIDNVNKK